MTEVNKDFTEAVVERVDPEQLESTAIVEALHKSQRRTLLHRIPGGSSLVTSAAGSEILVIEGDCRAGKQVCGAGYYLRIAGAESLLTEHGCVVFEKSAQYLDGDTGNRVIDTRAVHHWLPGPVEGISICPLHVFDSESIMLLRWDKACEFKPKLDPQGEELLVVSGLLQHRDALFKPYTWLRNPVEDWRRWHGATGTLVYYKSGHFPRT